MKAPGDTVRLTPELLLRAYALGVFPMARSARDRRIHWVSPVRRGILPLDGLHVPRRLARTVRSDRFAVRCNTAFADVIAGCAAPAEGRTETWINGEIRRSFIELHHLGFAHSVETWAEGDLVGGLYGVALGGAFFGESMFSRATDASKVALVHLVARLNLSGFVLLDVQFVTDHLKRLGAIEVAADDYLRRLDGAILLPVRFYSAASSDALSSAVEAVLRQSRTQRS